MSNIRLTTSRLEQLRDKLRVRGQRPSMVAPGGRNSQDVIESAQIAEEWGAFCEAMYLMMAADRRVLNVEREVLRGALAVLSGDRVRTRHMESMLDLAARNIARDGAEKRTQKVIEALREDPARAESVVICAAAIAAADQQMDPAEQELLDRLVKGLNVSQARADEILKELEADLGESPQK
ncbi:MAG: TerB family tellurite resistance protein [Polyangiales bacterium]